MDFAKKGNDAYLLQMQSMANAYMEMSKSQSQAYLDITKARSDAALEMAKQQANAHETQENQQNDEFVKTATKLWQDFIENNRFTLDRLYGVFPEEATGIATILKALLASGIITVSPPPAATS